MKKLVVLDLDMTLICAVENLSSCKLPRDRGEYKKGKKFGPYWIFPRPFLQEFLDTLFRRYRVAVWTAASYDYAMFVIDKFVERRGRKLEFIQWDSHCDCSEEQFGHQKKMSVLNALERGPKVILDDADHVMESQRKYVVDSRAWNVEEEGAENDDFLFVDALDEIKEKLGRQKRRPKSRSKSR